MQQITGSDILNTWSYSPGRILELIPGNLGMIFHEYHPYPAHLVAKTRSKKH
jgi:hypothetical protein